MYCRKCGTEQKENQKFCPKCGTPYQSRGNERNASESNYRDFREVPFQTPEAPTNTTGSRMSVPKIIAIVIGLIAIIALVFGGVLKMPKSNLVQVFSSQELKSNVDGIPFKSSKNGRWGMLRPDGTILFEEEFKDPPTVARDGRFFIRNRNGICELYTAEEHPERIGDDYISIGEFYNGVAPAVKKNERISLIDKEGNILTYLEKSGSKPITKMENFHYGYALFEAGDAVGIINTKGEILLEARKYCKILHIAPKRFLALDMRFKDETEKQNLVFDVIDPEGNRQGTIRMSKYSDICVLDDGYIGIEQTSDGEKLYGIMDLNGEVIVRPTSKIRGLTGYNNGKFIFTDGEYMGIRTVKDEVLIRPKYDAIEWATADMIWATSVVDERREVTLVDLEGNKITREPYLYALPFYDGKHALVQITDNTWSIINDDGEEQKNVPDIYTIRASGGDQVIVSDYMDTDAIIAAVKMTPNGFGGFGINMTPLELLKTYNENCDRNERYETNPTSVNRTDRLSYTKQEITKGVNLNVQLYYEKYITERSESFFDKTTGEWIPEKDIWTKEAPQYIRMTISGPRMQGKTGLVYKKLAVKAKTYGQVVKENDHACIIKQKNGRGMILVDNGSEVWGMIKDIETLRNENIDQYSNLKTRSNNNYVDTDSVAEVFEDLGY